MNYTWLEKCYRLSTEGASALCLIPTFSFGSNQRLSRTWPGWGLWNICVTNDHGYVPLVVSTSRSFPHSWLITGFVTGLTRRVPLMEQERLTLLEHLSWPPVFSGIRVTRSLVLCVFFVDRCLSFCIFLLAIVFSVLLQYTDSHYPFGTVSSNSSCHLSTKRTILSK
jgi:hypothetical protein